MEPITPFLWFDGQAEEAATFYTSLFKNSQILKRTYYDASAAKASGQPKGSVMTVAFKLNNQDFVVLNGGPHFKINEAVSFVVNCKTQAEIDHFWEKLSAGGRKGQCGWLKDKFGVSWQIVPANLGDLLTDKDTSKTQRVMHAILQMTKIRIATLKKACTSNHRPPGKSRKRNPTIKHP